MVSYKKIIKNKLFLSLIVLLIFLFLTSCNRGSSQEEVSVNLEQNYQSGYNGLKIELVENYPPENVFVNSVFSIAIKLSNQGAYKLFDGTIEVLGFDNQFIEMHDLNEGKRFPVSSTYMYGKNIENPSGDINHIEFSGQTKELKRGAESYDATFFVKAGYDYSNELVTTVCVNPSSYEVYDGGCKAQDTLTFYGQGAPLSITEIEQITNTGGDKEIRFVVTIENKGSGEAESITLTDYKIGGESMECEFRKNSNSNSNMFIFEEEQKVQLVCNSAIIASSSYETSLHISYHFTYSEKIKGSFNLLE